MENKKIDQILETYLDKILYFAYAKTNNIQDAEDLAQDILVEVIKSLSNQNTEISNVKAYIAKISQNVFFKKLRQSQKASYVELTGHEYEDDHNLDSFLTNEEKALLRREISFLSSTYRFVISQYYFDNLSINEIAKHHNIPPGTVKWWLFQARNELKKGLDTMRLNGEQSFNPSSLNVGITGSSGVDNSPFIFVNDNLIAQNILIAAYKKPLSEEEISQELGVARPYIESELNKLTRGELIKKIGPKYQTDFVISDLQISQRNRMVLEENYSGIKTHVLEFINHSWNLFELPALNIAGFERKRTLWVAVPLVMDLLRRTTYHKIIPTKSVPPRPSGGSWIALGTIQNSSFNEYNAKRYGYNGTISSYFNDSQYGQRVLFHQYSDFDPFDFIRDVLQDTSIKHNPIVLLCLKVATNQLNLETISEDEQVYLALAIKYKLIIKDGHLLKPNFYFLPKEKLEQLQSQCAELGQALLPLYTNILNQIVANIQISTPSRLWDQIGYFAGADFGFITPMILEDLFKAGELSKPNPDDKHLLSYYLWG